MKSKSNMTPDSIRKIRVQMNLNIAQFADKLGMSKKGYEKYEYGERQIPRTISILTSYLLKEFKEKTNNTQKV